MTNEELKAIAKNILDLRKKLREEYPNLVTASDFIRDLENGNLTKEQQERVDEIRSYLDPKFWGF